MPIDNNGVITPKKARKSKKDIVMEFIKYVPTIAVIGLIISGLTLFYQKKNLDLQMRQYEKQIEELNIELKEGYTQIKVSYLQCNYSDLNVLYEDEKYVIVNNSISELFKNRRKKNNLNDLMNIKDKWYIDAKILFLNIESFGVRNMTDLKILFKEIENTKDTKDTFKNFDIIERNLLSNDCSELLLGDREAGKSILMPVVLTYDTYSMKKYNRQIRKDGVFDLSNPSAQYIFRCMYIPKRILYKDTVSNKNFNIIVRDVLDDSIQINVYVE